MPSRERYDPGTFCWVDAIVPEPAAAIAFYGAVFGWGATDTGMMYWLFTKDGAPVAGLATLTEEMQAQGMPPLWSTAVSVEDVDAAAARLIELGGQVATGPMDVPETGRMAVVADPHGAGFVLWQAAPFPGAARVNEVGTWAWNDLQAPDPAAVAPFYEQLFGWQIDAIPESAGVYSAIANAGRPIGGIMQAPPGVQRPFWATYFGVEDVDEAIETVQAAGGRHVFGPVAVPSGRFAAVADSQGAMFSLVEGEFDD